MHGATFLQDLAIVMMAAALVTVLFHKLRLPVVLGYILAGVLIGPHVLAYPLISDETTIKTLAELGIVFLMFSLGLEFSFRRLRKVGTTALITAPLEILLMILVGYEVGQWFGWTRMDSLFLGAMISISSTTIIVKALQESRLTKEPFAQIIFGILIVEDLLAIVLLALLSGLAMTGGLQAGQVADTLGRLGIFLVVAVVLGLLLVPRLLGWVTKFRSNEVLLVTVLGLCFGVSLLALRLGYSVALGAFIIGAVVAEAREIGRIEILVSSLRDLFCAVFFVAIGLLIEPKLLAEHWAPIVVITLAVVIGKSVACAFGAFVAGNDNWTSMRVGNGLGQIGEFSFIIAALGLQLKVTSDFLYPIAVAVSVITAFLTPVRLNQSDNLVAWWSRHAPRALTNYLDLYTEWLGRFRANRKPGLVGRMVRKWFWQMGLNVVLTAGVFIVAAFLGQRKPAWLPKLPGGDIGLNAFLWLGATVLALPLLIANFRKLQALGLLVAEVSVRAEAAGERTASIRTVIAQGIPLAGAVGLGLLVLVLSSPLLPPLEVLLVLLLVVALVMWAWWRAFVRWYSKAQVALIETFESPPPARPESTTQYFRLLSHAQLRVVLVDLGSPVVGKLIRELELRTRTGASIVGIERNGESHVNPGPDEEVRAGDKLLLLGSGDQLTQAAALFHVSDDE
ncbi:MAG: cation/H(+) antiporter [Proteobacteria bacterium]|nr:cation/H(+) antiporter [Verrucomicrobiota bacterium]NBU09068.1 cation/H(+) antiporter [Pseudomonadota bacterium]